MATSAMVVLVEAGPAQAASYVVNSTADGADISPGNGVRATALGTCTLRAALQDAQALGSVNSISLTGLPNPSTIDLGSPLPLISNQTLTITGLGKNALTVRRTSGGDYAVFSTREADVTISGMTVTGGRAVLQDGRIEGGGIYSFRGSLVLDDVAVVGNTAVDSMASFALATGGGVYKEQGTLSVRNSTISQNTVQATSEESIAIGGGIGLIGADLNVVKSTISLNNVSATGSKNISARGGGIGQAGGGRLEMADTTVSGNSVTAVGTNADFADARGGGIDAVQTDLSILTTTIDHNSATVANATNRLAIGGGINGESSPGAVTNSTISANSVSATGDPSGMTVNGGGIAWAGSPLTITALTIAFNSSPAGTNLDTAAAAVRLRDTILSNPMGGGTNCLEIVTPIVSDGYNLASDASCNLVAVGDQPSTDPALEVLADNGGPTRTHALSLASPAVDRGSAAASGNHPAMPTDQRGKPRPFDQPTKVNALDGSDIGAFELQEVTKASPTISTQASSGNLLGAPASDVATVAAGNSPTGTVTFRLFSDSTCQTEVFNSTNAVVGGSATSGFFTPAAVGTYYWTAVYNGDPNNNMATSACGASNESVTITAFAAPPFTRTVTGDLLGPVTVNSGDSVQLLNARVVGPVTVNPGGALTLVNAQVSLGIVVDKPGFLSICGSSISGPAPDTALAVSNASVPIRIGDPATGCAGNRFAGQVTFTANLAVTFGANSVSHNATFTGNGPGGTVVKANTVFGTLACSANVPAPTNAGQPNTAGTKTGQCTSV